MGFSEKLFSNPGGQLKKYAIRVFWSILIGCSLVYLIGAIYMIVEDEVFIPLILTPVAVLIFYGIAWLAAIRTYAFGELVENSSYLKPKNSKTPSSTSSSQNKTNTKNNNKRFTNNESTTYESLEQIDIRCPHCNETLTFYKEELKDTNTIQCPWCYKDFEANPDYN